MKLVTADFRKLRSNIVAALVMIIIGVTILYFAGNARRQAQLAKTSALGQRAEADAKLKQVRDEESDVKEKSIIFNKLQERGIIGEEQRLEWVELLKDIREKRRLLDLRYEISPQRPLDGSAGDFAFFSSTMKLDLKLLHEEDLARLLADLRSRAKALIIVRSCDVSRLPSTADERISSRANLAANCEIDWLTLREVGKK